jgi:hypothetical protein
MVMVGGSGGFDGVGRQKSRQPCGSGRTTFKIQNVFHFLQNGQTKPPPGETRSSIAVFFGMVDSSTRPCGRHPSVVAKKFEICALNNFPLLSASLRPKMPA